MKKLHFGASLLVGWLTLVPVLAAPPVAGPQVWLTADQGVVTDGSGNVSQWQDQSGNGFHFEQATAAKQPVLTAQGFAKGESTLVKIPRTYDGNTTTTWSIGMDFVVDQEVVVSDLAAFDDLRDGFTNTITVQLYQRNDGGTPQTRDDDTAGAILEQLTFTPAAPGTLDGRFRWKPLAAPRTLAPGSYTLVSWGFTGADRYYSSSSYAKQPLNSGIRWGGSRYSGTAGQWPLNLYSDTTDYFAGAMNLRFHRSGVTPSYRPALRFDGSDDGLQAVAALNVGRPSTVFAVFEREVANDGGYILQNSAGGNWWFRTDGFYSDGWVRNIDMEWGVPHIGGMVSTATGTRAYDNFSDLTAAPGLTTPAPGRLAMGGGSGQQNDPLAMKIAELIVYDRQLSDSEIWQTQSYLADRYGVAAAAAETPAISPPGDSGTGNVAVTLTTGTPGAQIRYTTDGSEPTAASALYSAALNVPRGTQVKARAFAAGVMTSGTASQFYANSAALEVPVGGMLMWLRGDRGVDTDRNGAVTRWHDLTGNGNDLVQGTEWQRPRPVQAFPKNGGTAIESFYPGSGASTHGGTLGTDFEVTSPVTIDQLGAFDHQSDGFAGTITVQIWSRDTHGTLATPEDDTAGSLLAEAEFTNSSPGTLDNGTRFKAITPINLPVGSYSILAWGFVGADLYRNTSDATWLEDGIRFVNRSRYIGTNGTWPTTIDSHPVKYNGAGNFKFHRTSTPATLSQAVEFDGADDGLWALPTSFIPRSSTVYVAFERYDDGQILQNTASGWWFVRGDGVYSDGWVRNRNFSYGTPNIVGVTNGPAQTRAYVNGEEWTVTSNVGTVPPGCLALGGGNGTSYDPAHSQVGEVIAFDRVLSAAERWQVENYLSLRYRNQPVPLPPVEISPSGDYGAGNVSVTLAQSVPGAQIRYTTDGSAPTASSTLYSGAFSVSRGTRVRAAAFLAGATTSALTEVFYGQAGGASDLPVAGAKMWLRADAGLETDAAGGVSRWRDLTGNGNDVLQPFSVQRPVVKSGAFAADGGTAIRVTEAEGRNTYGGTLGEDFAVDQTVTLTHLGAFDHRKDGFSGTITVQLWSRNDQGTPNTQSDDTAGVLLAQATFTNADPGTLEGTLRFKQLASAVTLPPGSYTVYAWGYTGFDYYYEGGDRGTYSADSRFHFLGVSRYSGSANAWPSTLDSGHLDYNGAANFKTQPAGGGSAGQPAVVFDGVDDGLQGVEGMNFGRPSTVLAVFQRDRNESGYVVQNNGGGNWWIRNDGIYADGWVRNEEFAINQPYLTVVSNGVGFTRLLRNGVDVTATSSVGTVAPGRLALGGGVGQQNDPIPVRISELVVFDRVLDSSELWSMQNYLALRSGVYQPEVEPPAISPASGYGTGSVAVTLSTSTPGAQIRYTLDGSDPTGSSTLYTAGFTVPRGTQVRARAFLAGSITSGVSQAFYGEAATNPLPASGAAMWLRADTGVETRADGSVFRWRDLSGNGRDLLPTTREKSPQLAHGVFGGAIRNAVEVPAGTLGGTNYAGAVGTDFIVDQPVEITHLGAFDHFADGFAGTITVRIHRIDDHGTPAVTDDTSAGVLATRTFTAAAPGTLEGTTRFLPLDSPLALTPGRYFVESYGWIGADRYIDGDSLDESSGEGITFPGQSRYSSTSNMATIFPGNLVGDNRYVAAGNFKFRKQGATAVPLDAVRFDGVDDGLLGPVDFLVGRPSTIFLIFNERSGTDGRLLQSGNGNNFLIGPHVNTQDGLYAEGWVGDQTIRRNQLSQSVAVLATNDSRYFYNGVDLTTNPNPTGLLGRVALGGGEGTYNQPVSADLAELVIYDRVLTPVERQQVSAALAARYGLPLEPLLAPAASPDGGLYAGSQNITLSHPLAGAQIRYTTDGSEPTESSTLYTTPLTVPASRTIKSRAFAAGYLPSPVQESVFVIDPAATPIPQRQALQVWLRAGIATEQTGGAVSLWRDLSGKGMDAFQSTAASRPVLDPTVVGGAPGIVFDGSDDFMRLPEGFADLSQGLTAIFVVRAETVGSYQRFMDLGRGPANNNVVFTRNSTTTSFDFATNSKTLTSPASILPSSNTLISVSLMPDGTAKVFTNGSLTAETSAFPLPPTILRTINLIGESNWSSDVNYSGAISEILFYNQTLGDLDRETLETAVRTRYGISSSATGTVAFSPDPAALYPNGVDVTMSSVTPNARIRYTLDGTAPTEASSLYGGPVHLSASKRIRARAFADGFNASQFSEATYLIGQPPSGGDGLLANYFNNKTLDGTALVRVDPTINFDFGGGSPDPGINAEGFSARWTGKVMPRFTEAYTFYTSCDDGARLWVDLNRDGVFDDATELLVNDWTAHGEIERASAAVNLTAGQLYDIKMEYYEDTSVAVARLRWSSAFSQPKQIIPQSQLFSNAAFGQTAGTPVITPAAGTYNAAVEVSISTATAGATLYYTVDGSEPGTTSQVYGGAFTVNADTTVRAKAYKAGFNPSGIATASYHIDALPPVIGAFKWDGDPIANGETFTNKGVFTAEATDNGAVTSAEFYYTPSGTPTAILIGRDTYLPDGLSAPWDVSAIPDGDYTVTARVYDNSGIWSEITRTISVDLDVPPAPQITQPLTGISVQDPVVALRVQSVAGANIRIFRDDVFLFSGYASAAGIFDYSAPLPTGASVFKAVAQNRAGASPPSNTVSVTRVREFPQLTLTFSENTLMEGNQVTGTVRIPAAEAANVVVQIATDRASRVQAVDPVVIPAGSTSATFLLSSRQNATIELLASMSVTASAPEHRSAIAELFLADDDYPDIDLTLDKTSVSEDQGTVTGTLRRALVTSQALRVNLVNSNPSEVTVPAYVDIPANATEATFSVTVINDTADDGNQIATLKGQVLIGATVVSQTPAVDLEIRDDEGPSLTLEVARPYLAEGASLSGTVRRAGAATTSALTVTLSQSPTGQLTVPPTVTIPTGQTQASFTIAAPASPVSGTRVITLRAAAASYTDGLAPLTLTDSHLAELVPGSLVAPATVLTEQYAPVSYRIENFGFEPARGPFLERVFLSKDRSLSGDDLLVRQTEFTGEIAAGAGFGRNVTILTPRDTGAYYLIVTVDSDNSVAELDEGNNTTVLPQPIEVRPAYTATVQTTAEVVPANTPIVFTGSATKDGGLPATFTMVNIHIWLNGTDRVISAVTNSLGQFSVTWTPLRNEGGSYKIGASHPGVSSAPEQDAFEILTLGFDAPGGIVLNEGETVVAQAVLRNPNARPLTGLSMTVGTLPGGLTVTPALPGTTLAAGATMNVPITVSAASGFSGNGSFPLTVQTTEGVTMQAGLNVRAELLRPALALDPASLNTAVLRETSKSVSFQITNTGGLETGAIQVLLPDLPWLTLASANPIPSIPPGGTASVSVVLAPTNTVPLTQYTGNLALNPANGNGRAVPYQFRVVSDLKGDLNIDVVDELFYFTAEAPKLQGASVTVRDAVTSATVATIETNAAGRATFAALPEGWYRVDISAPEHDSLSGNYYVNAGQNNLQQLFISKQLVKYTWKVEEFEIQDVYRVNVETTFETNVPAPVVTATPGNFDVSDLVALGQSKIINVTLENHGFIAAQHSKWRFSEHPFYEFTPLVTNIGTIPAKSSLVVPVTITRVGIFGDDGEIITLRDGAPRGRISKQGVRNASVPCGAGAAIDYDYPCGEWAVEKVVVMAINGVQGYCGGGGPTGGGGYYGFVGGFYSPGGGSGPGGGGITTSSGAISFSSPEGCLPICLARATVDCAINFTPVGCAYAIAQCVITPAFDNCAWALVGCVKNVPIVNAANCIYSFAKCFYEDATSGKKAPRGPLDEEFVLDDAFRSFSPEVAASWTRVEPLLRMLQLQLGSKELAMANGTPEGQVVLEAFSNAILESSPGGLVIDSAEATDLVDLTAGAELDPALMSHAIERWNRTRDYYSRGIHELAEVPAGESTDFIDATSLKTIGQQVVASYDASRAEGFIDPLHEFLSRSADLRDELKGGQGGTCARVKIQLSQDVMMTRTAFRATLELENERADGAITNVGFDLRIHDSLDQPAEDLFNVQVTKLTGLGAIDGTGEIAAKGIGSVQWTLIPRDTAAQEEIKTYTIGGVIHYTQNGTEFNIPVENVPITVRPDASLDLKYFHQRDVFSDDPHTDPIEPSQPYKLAVMVENNGFGDARNLKIISGQPQIVDNEKGLFIDFKVIGTEVDGQPLSPSLTADFGTVGPGQRKIATWLMTSTLQGLFTDYSATFEHVTGLGDKRISLLKSVEIHEMIHMVKAQGARDDGAPDFLVNDVVDANDYPDTIHYSNGGTDLVTVKQTGTFTGTLSPGNLTLTLNTGAFTGWSYIRLPDPAAGGYRLVSVKRDDGRDLAIDFNAWQTDRTFIGGGRRPRYENILHLADSDSSGVYTLTYQPVAPPDLTPPTSLVSTLPAVSLPEIPVSWTGSDNQSVAVFDVFVSVDNGPFALWKSKTAETGALYPGETGKSYAFYSLATDNAGNLETKSATPEASTTVGAENQPPVIAVIPNQSVDEGNIFHYRATATDPDGSSGSIRFSVGASVSGVVIDPVSGDITWTTSETDGGKTANIVVVATDSGFPAAVSNRSFTLTVVDVNSPPVITPVGPQTIQSGGVLIVDVDAIDGDSPVQTVSYSLMSGPAGSTINAATGVINWSPTPLQAGASHLFTVRATDSGTPAKFAEIQFAATVVAPTDRAPLFTKVPVVIWTKGQSYSLTVAATDPDGDPIALTANVSSAAGASFTDQGSGSGLLSWNPSAANAGVYQIPVTATANGLTANATVRIRVAANDLYWNWVKQAFGDLPDGFDIALLEMEADPDGDGRGNVHEMALLTNPLTKDTVPVAFEADLDSPFSVIGLHLHRRQGSEAFVDLGLERSTDLLGAWEPVPPADWSVFIDADGDDDHRADSQSVDFLLYEFHPGGTPPKGFYRVKTTTKAVGP